MADHWNFISVCRTVQEIRKNVFRHRQEPCAAHICQVIPMKPYLRHRLCWPRTSWLLNWALADLKVLAADTRNVYGAEAKYLVAQIYFDEGKTETAENEVLQYIEVSTPHAYWLARSFVLLSDVYVKLGRKLDAKQYLLSLQQNYQADDDIAEMIETRLAKLNQ